MLEKIEVERAIEALTSADLLRLRQYAEFRIRGLGRTARGRTWEDLLERAGFGGAGGGMTGIRGITYLDGEILSTYPRDEVRGTVLRRTARLGKGPVLKFKAGVDPGRAWQLQVYVNDDKVLDKLIEGPLENREWEEVEVNLAKYADQEVVLRLYQRVLIPHREAGNAYWRNLVVN